jgi:hypothetical protein
MGAFYAADRTLTMESTAAADLANVFDGRFVA